MKFIPGDVTLSRIWLALFAYSAAVALLLQWVLLPHVFTGLHAGNGLLVGGDWVGFHQIAVELAEKIRAHGWSAWELRPGRQAPAGIAAALYVLTVPHPSVLIPLNAAIHAMTGVILVRIVQSIVVDIRTALACVLPFMLLPSALTWYAQIHKDGYYIGGMFFCLYGWILLSKAETWQQRVSGVLAAVSWIIVGCLLISAVRPYGIKLIQGIGVIFAALLVPLFVYRGVRRQLSMLRTMLSVMIVLALPLAFGVFQSRGAAGELEIVSREALHEAMVKDGHVPRLESAGNPNIPVGDFAVKASHFAAKSGWDETAWLPTGIDQILFTLALVRSGYAEPIAASNIDTEVVFHRASDFVAYLPRALQIGLTAPFPRHWFDQGGTRAGTLMRRISGVEMTLVYMALLFLPVALWLWRRKIEIWLTFTFCITLLLIYTYITPNVGTLYRSRHGYLMMLVAMGLAGAIAGWRRVFRRDLN